MVVQHNLTAMNSNRMLGLTTKTQAKSTEKLSSGYKINRAADDAAGLSISEKMRKQIRGLTQASANAQDGISAVQTAEGALNEVQDMLQRMNELAVKAANGTNSEDDRTYIQNEIDQLTTEIDRVAETTKFNETYLLKGDRDATQKYTYKYATPTTDAAATADMTAPTDTATNNLGVTGVTFEAGADKTSQNALAAALKNQGVTLTSTSAWDATGNKAKDTTYKLELNGSAATKFDVVDGADATTKVIQDKNGKKIATVTVAGGKAITAAGADVTSKTTQTATGITAAKVKGEPAEYFDKDGNSIPTNALDKYFSVNADGDVVARGDAPKVYDGVGNQTELFADEVTATQDLTGSLSLTLHVGADATSNNQITVNLDAMSAKGLGVNGLKVDGADDKNALSAIDTIKEAIQKVSTQRSALGAAQNRLEHTISNLDNVVENTTSAESQIRDTDMATEMVKYSNNNILSQAGQAMLAQANQSNQGVLSLLQ